MLSLLLGCATARATVGESNLFAFDTRDTNSAHYAESALFAFDTRESNSTHYNESAVFAFNTFGVDGLSGTRASGAFSFDTRSATTTGLAVEAPPNVSGGAAIKLNAIATFSSGVPEDVSDRAAWSVTGGPATTRMIGRTLHTGYSATPVTAFVQASYWRNAQQIISPLRSIVIGPALKVTLAAQQPIGVGSGGATSWTLRATAAAIGGVAPFQNVQWRWRGNDLSQTSLTLAEAVGGPLGPGQLDVTITDANGKIGSAFTVLSLNKAPVTGQPLQTIVTRQNEPATLYHSDGLTGVNLLAERKNAGLLVIVHGLIDRVELPNPNQPGSGWMMRTAQAIEAKLTGTTDGPPNVLLYDWNESANPSKYFGTDAKNAAAKAMLAELKDRRYLLAGIGFAPVFYDALTPVEQKLTDIRYVREIADRQGEALEAWIDGKISAGEVSANEEIHLIGHSAGGFVAATCAGRMLARRALPKLLVTTLDTPMFRAKHIKDVKDHGGRIERYKSQLGWANPALATIPDRRRLYPSLFYTGGSSLLLQSLPIVIPDPGYRVGSAASTGTCPTDDFFALHSEAHEWYIASVQNAASWRDGFYYSPFLGNTWSGTAAAAAALAFAGDALPSPPDQSLGGFQAFGQVIENAGEFTLTEAEDAGLFQTLTVPTGATDLKFRLRFEQIGDGDFLEVSFGDHPPLAVIDLLAVNAAQWIEYVIPADALAGETGTLVFRLVSRGASNAVVRLDSLAFAMSDDPDEDGLSIAEEALRGTDPLVFDTDGDGFGDGYEVATLTTNPLDFDTDGDGADDYMELLAGTDPRDNTSVFAVTEFSRAGAAFVLRWTGIAGKTYRIFRSPTPDFATFEILASGIPGAGAATTFTDTATNTITTPAAFYRVEAE